MLMTEDKEKILSDMTRAEKAELLQWIVRDLGDAFPGIDSRPGVMGGANRQAQSSVHDPAGRALAARAADVAGDRRRLPDGDRCVIDPRLIATLGTFSADSLRRQKRRRIVLTLAARASPPHREMSRRHTRNQRIRKGTNMPAGKENHRISSSSLETTSAPPTSVATAMG